MTQAVTTQPSSEFSPARIAFGAAFMGSATTIAASLFTSVNPLGGAIFGVSSFLGHCLVHWICDQANCCPDGPIFKVGRFALSTLLSTIAALFMTTALGFPMTATTAVILTVTSIGVAISTILALGGCLCSSAVVTGIALGNSDPTTMIRP